MFFPSPLETQATINSCYTLEYHIKNTYGNGIMVDLDEKGDIKAGSKLKKSETPKLFIKGGKLKLGFKQFLSNHGKTTHLVRFKKGVYGQFEHVDFDFLRGKYLLICCFNVPMLADEAAICRAIIEAYDELFRNGIPFEMVVVPKMRSDVLYNQQAAFDHFCSAFSCLGIPFSDFETRAYLHSFISSGFRSGSDSAILVDPKGTILQEYDALEHFFCYSSNWFPFLDSTLDAIFTQDELLRSRLDPMYSTLALMSRLDPTFPFTKDIVEGEDHRPLSLSADILLCHPLLTLSRFDAETDVLTTVLDLSRKYVGLYLFLNGQIMAGIKAVHDYCLAHNQQLEIVLVPMSFYDEPTSHYKDLCEALRHLDIKSWFLFHYCSNVCRRLWRIFGQGSVWRGEDKLIIIPPDCKSGELCGREVITNFGINEYPFTRTAILRRRLEYVRSLTPVFPSLFNNNCLIQNGKKFKSEQLQGKNVLLYLAWNKRDLDTLLIKYYPVIEAKGWEVVFVPLKYPVRYWNVDSFERDGPCVDLDKMPWPFMPPSAAAKASIKEKLVFPEDQKTSYLFAVGEDGKIVSRDVEGRLLAYGLTESLFADVLERDLAYGLAEMPLLED